MWVCGGGVVFGGVGWGGGGTGEGCGGGRGSWALSSGPSAVRDIGHEEGCGSPVPGLSHSHSPPPPRCVPPLSGTLSGNPLAMTAGIKTLEILDRPGSYEHLDKVTSRWETFGFGLWGEGGSLCFVREGEGGGCRLTFCRGWFACAVAQLRACAVVHSCAVRDLHTEGCVLPLVLCAP